MNQTPYFGGAQAPLSRAYLRAASLNFFSKNKPEFANIQIFASLNDIDIPGLRYGEKPNSFLADTKKILNVVPSEEWGRTQKEEWLPINWKFPFHTGSKFLVNTGYPENLVIGGLPFGGGLRHSLIFGTFCEIHSVLEIITQSEFRDRLPFEISMQILERAALLKRKTIEIAEVSQSINDFWSSLARFMLGKNLDGVITDTLTDFFKVERDNEPQFELLNEFLAHPVKSLNLYRKFKPAPGGLLPFWLIRKKEEYLVREKIYYKRGGKIFVENQQIGDGIKNSTKLREALVENGITNSVIAPKIFLLIPSFRFTGVHYCTDPTYLGDLNEFSKQIGLRQSPLLSVKHDMSKVLSPHVWTLCCQFLKKHMENQDAYNRKISEWKYNPTLTFVWLIGGPNVVNDLVESASPKWVR